MPIPLGIFATAGAGGAGGSAFELISTQVLTSSASSVTFSSIPATYKHLQVRAVARDTGAVNVAAMHLRINSDSASNYRSKTLTGSGSSVFSFSYALRSELLIEPIAGGNAGTSVFGPTVIDLLDYSSTSKNTTIRHLSGVAAASNFVILGSGLWMNTSAVSNLSIAAGNTAFATGSRFSLYGIKG